MARKRLGELLLERGIIDQRQLEHALTYQRQTGYRLGTALVALKHITEDQLCGALAQALGLPVAKMPPDPVDWKALHTLRARFCEANDLFPLAISEPASGRKQLLVAMADPLNVPAIEEIEFTTGMKVIPALTSLTAVRLAVRQHYLKQAPPAQEPEISPEQMTIIRQGRGEEVVGTAAGSDRKPTLEELPTVDLDIAEEVTSRTALAELIAAKAEERKARRKAKGTIEDDLGYLFGHAHSGTPEEEIEKLERRFWALLRILAKKGLLTNEEFLRELADDE